MAAADSVWQSYAFNDNGKLGGAAGHENMQDHRTNKLVGWGTDTVATRRKSERFSAFFARRSTVRVSQLLFGDSSGRVQSESKWTSPCLDCVPRD
jgi:hypothetical protein